VIIRIQINYLKEPIDKIIRIPLNAKIEVKKEKDEYIITLEDYCDTNLFIFKESQVDKNYPFSIERLS
jgi:hypothetical protein